MIVVKARGEKLVAMCEAQVASLRSRLERRVNRIPNSKRNMSLVELLDPSANAPVKVAKPSPAKKENAPAPVPVRAATQPAARKTRAPPAKAAPKPAPKPTIRGKKRPSDDGDKENEELNVPKKRVKPTAKTATSASAPATRGTRAASKKMAPTTAAQVLSPKPTNNRPATRTRRAR